MHMLEAMNRALDYLEEHLADEIDMTEVERLALCSEFHFKKMFAFLAGISLTEYIRRRRLTLAAFELSDSSARIIDIAVKYGYGSPDAFTRAFASLHGLTPTEARSTGQTLKAYPRMSFQLTVKGGNEMKYRIEEKEAFRIAGIMKRVPIVFNGVNPEIAAMRGSLTAEKIASLKALSNIEPNGTSAHPLISRKSEWKKKANWITISAPLRHWRARTHSRVWKCRPAHGRSSKR